MIERLHVENFKSLRDLDVALLSERRSVAPFGLAGGQPGAPGRDLLNGVAIAAKTQLRVNAGDRLRIETPGGGAYGLDPASTAPASPPSPADDPGAGA